MNWSVAGKDRLLVESGLRAQQNTVRRERKVNSGQRPANVSR